ncbi:MAG TPA: tripartite tricarboxylate transporter substrate-binding protein [Microbacterium sp.]|nr:tripartite tricarboxylate transporter substrate-binding protein [Microbacterium sp.]
MTRPRRRFALGERALKADFIQIDIRKIDMHFKRFSLAAVLLTVAASGAAFAQAPSGYPCKLIKLVSPYPAGGTTDILARLIQPGLGQELGATVIVENRAGASSNIGTEFVASAPPDGCTLLLGNNTGVAINRNLYKLRIDPVKGLAPIGMVASVPLVLYVNAKVTAKSFSELMALAKSEPGKLSYASGGSGSPQHLMGELLKLEQKIDVVDGAELRRTGQRRSGGGLETRDAAALLVDADQGFGVRLMQGGAELRHPL